MLYEEYFEQMRQQETKEKAAKQASQKQFYQDISEFLKRHRIKLGWGRKKLCKKADISMSNYLLYEQGERAISLYNFVKLCQVMKIDFHYDGSYRTEPGEREWLDHFRHCNVKAILEWVLKEM